METKNKGLGKVAFLIIGLLIGVALSAIITFCLMLINSNNTSVKDNTSIIDDTSKNDDMSEDTNSSEKIEGSGYDTAEDAVEAYVNYLKEGNLNGAFSTFAVESYVDNYDMNEYYDYSQSFNPYMPSAGQITNAFYFDSDMSRDLNIESRKSYILTGIQKQLLQIVIQNTDEDELTENPNVQMNFKDDNISTEQVMNFLSTDPDLDSIEIGDFLEDKDFDLNNYDPIELALERQEKIWGGDVDTVMVELEIGGDDYTLFMLCVCYDDKWYLADFNNVVGLSLNTTALCKGLVPSEDLP